MVYKEKTQGEDILTRAETEKPQSTLLAIRASYYLFAEGKYGQAIEALKGSWKDQRLTPEATARFRNECKESRLMESGRLPGVVAVLEKLSPAEAKMLIIEAANIVVPGEKADFSELFKKPAIKAALDSFKPAVGEKYGTILEIYLTDQPRALRVAASSANPESPQYRE